MSEFVGAVGTRAFLIESVRAAFIRGNFNICAVHKLPEYDSDTFANWVSRLHCVDCDSNTLRRAKFYVVNYFLCPNSEDEFEVEAMYHEVFEPVPCDADQPKKEGKVVMRIGCWKLVKA